MKLRRERVGLALVVATQVLACAPSAPAPAVDVERSRQAVLAAERAFAQTMADRDHAAFTTFLAAEAVFFAGDAPIRGRAAVADSWRPYFDGEQAPFAWEPATVEVLDSGTLALSSGPVYGAQGELIATFNSIWRLDDDGRWRIVFDKGSAAPCACD